ncbi:MAG: LysR family transcriptional regulator [Myxococcota bacterium]
MMAGLLDRTIFIAVSECESFSHAAARLGIPVSTVSRRIAHLEAELGVPLLERTTRHVRTTELGLEYASQLRPLLDRVDDLEALVSARSSLTTGILRIASPTGLGHPFLGAGLLTFRESHPEIELVWTSSDADPHPIRDRFDIVITDRRIVDKELIARKALTTRDVCTASPRYLDRAGRPRSVRDLVDHAALVRGPSHGLVRWPLPRGGTVHVAPALRCNDYGLLVEAAIAGLGIALLPHFQVSALADEQSLEVVLDGVVGVRRDIYVTYSRSARERAVVRAFVEFALEYAKVLPS